MTEKLLSVAALDKPCTAMAVEPVYDEGGVTLYRGDARDLSMLADESVQCCVTSPPYWGLRDYGVASQIGLEATPAAFVENMVAVFREVRRVLKPDGVIWVNLGDCYASTPPGNKATGWDKWKTSGLAGAREGSQYLDTLDASVGKKRSSICDGLKPKDLIGIPWRVAFALQADGWYLRSDIIWHKPNPMPESVTDRPTKSHEYLFLLSKSDRYFYDADAIAEPAVSDHDSGNSFAGRQGGAEHMPMSGGVGGPQWKRKQRKSDATDMNGRSLQGQNGEAERRDVPGSTFNNNPRLRGSDGTRNARSVWTINVNGYPGAHFATFPQALPERCILAGSKPGDLVLDPFNGSGTTGAVCRKWGRRYVGVDLNAEYLALSVDRFRQGLLFAPEARSA